MLRFTHAILLSFALLVFANSAFAHQLSTAYLTVKSVDELHYTGQLQLRIDDISKLVPLDNNNDGDITWAEIVANKPVLRSLILERIKLQNNSGECPLNINDKFKLDTHFNDNYLVAGLQSTCSSPEGITLSYTGLFEIDASHKLLVNFTNGNDSVSRTLDKDTHTVALLTDSTSRSASFIEFVKQGVIHIAIGYDHILFLVCLLLACVLGKQTEKPKKNAETNFAERRALISYDLTQTLIMVTSFTLAHSITLTLVAMDWLQVSSRWVEIAIAASIAIAAFNNIYPFLSRIFYLSFGFGLIHGMGFAGVLSELGLPTSSKLPAIIAFNLGVEIGQIAIVFLAYPALVFLKRHTQYQKQWLIGSSVVIIAISVQWIVERAAQFY